MADWKPMASLQDRESYKRKSRSPARCARCLPSPSICSTTFFPSTSTLPLPLAASSNPRNASHQRIFSSSPPPSVMPCSPIFSGPSSSEISPYSLTRSMGCSTRPWMERGGGLPSESFGVRLRSLSPFLSSWCLYSRTVVSQRGRLG
jgi:hypothetical protein